MLIKVSYQNDFGHIRVKNCEKKLRSIKSLFQIFQHMENETSQDERPPFFQIILNDIMLLLFLGVTIFVVFYIAWGFIELGNVPNMPDEIKEQVMSPNY